MPCEAVVFAERLNFKLAVIFPKFINVTVHFVVNKGGSSSNSAIIADVRNFRWISGQEQISSYVKPTGFRSDFCSQCGSPVPNPLRKTAYYWVPAGLLDDNMSLEVGAHLFVGSKASWDTISSSVPQYETMPELSEFFELMHSRV
jgi:hypothetical protein